MSRYRLVIFSMFLTASTSGFAGDTLEEYAQKCDEAIGITIPDFSCDAGTLVPTTHMTPASASYPNGSCDRPDQLNQECDAASRFQLLPGSDDHAFAVAHCRKQGLGPGQYGDIAVIQHNKDNGATCFSRRNFRESAGGRVVGAESPRYLWCWHGWRDVSQSVGRGLAPLAQRLGASGRHLHQSACRGRAGV